MRQETMPQSADAGSAILPLSLSFQALQAPTITGRDDDELQQPIYSLPRANSSPLSVLCEHLPGIVVGRVDMTKMREKSRVTAAHWI